MSDKEKLKQEISDHWPELDRRLGPMGWREVHAALAEFTGADVKSTDLIEDSCHLFTEALQRMRAEK